MCLDRSEKDGTGVYAAFFNLADAARTIAIALADWELDEYTSAKELWSGDTVSLDGGKLSRCVNPHCAAVFFLVR